MLFNPVIIVVNHYECIECSNNRLKSFRGLSKGLLTKLFQQTVFLKVYLIIISLMPYYDRPFSRQPVSATSLWLGLFVGRVDGWCCHNFPKGRTMTLPCFSRSNCSYFRPDCSRNCFSTREFIFILKMNKRMTIHKEVIIRCGSIPTINHFRHSFTCLYLHLWIGPVLQ